ncbi:MAG: alpha/beta hydrolase, partial [Terriglobia bacterium]
LYERRKTGGRRPPLQQFMNISTQRRRRVYQLAVTIFAFGFAAIIPSPLAGRILRAAAGVQSPGSEAASSTGGDVTTVQCGQVASKILGHDVNYCIDLPGDYAASGKRYPALYFLHGLFENEHTWEEKGGKEILDNLVQQGKIGRFLMVMPDGGRSFYVNSDDGKNRYEDFFIQEFIPAIDHLYRTIPQRDERGITGVSMGGYGSLHLAMRHSHVFGSASAQSAALVPHLPTPLPTDGRWGFYARIMAGAFGSPLNRQYFEENNPLTLAEDPAKFHNLKLYFDVGDHDRYGFNEGNSLLDQILTKKEFPHQFAIRPGNHGWSFLQDYMHYALEFHWKIFQAALPANGHY